MLEEDVEVVLEEDVELVLEEAAQPLLVVELESAGELLPPLGLPPSGTPLLPDELLACPPGVDVGLPSASTSLSGSAMQPESAAPKNKTPSPSLISDSIVPSF